MKKKVVAKRSGTEIICPVCTNKIRADLYPEQSINLKKWKRPVWEQENDIVIWISMKQYINEGLV